MLISKTYLLFSVTVSYKKNKNTKYHVNSISLQVMVHGVQFMLLSGIFWRLCFALGNNCAYFPRFHVMYIHGVKS